MWERYEWREFISDENWRRHGRQHLRFLADRIKSNLVTEGHSVENAEWSCYRMDWASGWLMAASVLEPESDADPGAGA